MIPPLNSHWEYEQAKRTCDILSKKPYSRGDFEEYEELKVRIELYERDPTQPNIIQHTKGNV